MPLSSYTYLTICEEMQKKPCHKEMKIKTVCLLAYFSNKTIFFNRKVVFTNAKNALADIITYSVNGEIRIHYNFENSFDTQKEDSTLDGWVAVFFKRINPLLLK